MASRKRSAGGDLERVERDLRALRGEVRALRRQAARHEERVRSLAKAAEDLGRRAARVEDVLRLKGGRKAGDRGAVGSLQGSVVRLEEYLLKTADRIETILTALKQHRELLVAVNRRVLESGTKDRIRLELDVMKNTLSILALHGIEFDDALPKDIEKLRERLRSKEDPVDLERAKSELDKKFEGELKKFDLDAIWSRKKDIPGYR